MTAIVGFVDGDNVIMGADSASMDGRYGQYDIADGKIFTNGEFVIGITGSPRAANLLRFKFEPPYHKPETDTYKYMCTEFIDAVRKLYKENGFTIIEDGQEFAYGSIMVAYRGKLFVINSDYQVMLHKHPYASIGCGDFLALGSLYSTEDKAPEIRVFTALRAAEQFSAGVRGPFIIKRLEGGKVTDVSMEA
jgi:ATP-dependent protease HslVU (ClpYQ) peptidase subunit